MEYAQGSDPLLAEGEAVSLHVLSTQPLCLEAPRNPDSPEINAIIQVSEDALAWRTATAAEISLKTGTNTTAFSVHPGGPRTRLFRIRYTGPGID